MKCTPLIVFLSSSFLIPVFIDWTCIALIMAEKWRTKKIGKKMRTFNTLGDFTLNYLCLWWNKKRYFLYDLQGKSWKGSLMITHSCKIICRESLTTSLKIATNVKPQSKGIQHGSIKRWLMTSSLKNQRVHFESHDHLPEWQLLSKFSFQHRVTINMVVFI